MIEEIKITLEDSLSSSMQSLQKQLARVRTGRASASVLDNVSIDYYGTSTPINQVAQISIPEARLLQIQPFDKSMIATIEKAIINSNLGLTPSNDGNLIRVPFPALTEEKRKTLVREVKKIGEDGKVTIRKFRREQNEVIRGAEKAKDISEDESKSFQKEVQVITDDFIKKIDVIMEQKEKELLTL